MSSSADWVRGYARQADADLKTWTLLQARQEVPTCHKLLFIQMACEKLCKAHLIQTGSRPGDFQSSHRYVAKPLPVIISQQIIANRRGLHGMRRVLAAVRHLAAEIELLNPAVKRDGKRPDNCEYPWEDHSQQLRSPLEWSFHPAHLLTLPFGRTFLKLLRGSIDRLLQPESAP